MGLETGSSRPDDIPPAQERRDQHPDSASARQPDQIDRRDQPPAETRTRGEYARAIRDDSASRTQENPTTGKGDTPAEQRDNDQVTDERPMYTEPDTGGRNQPTEPLVRPESEDTQVNPPKAPADQTSDAGRASDPDIATIRSQSALLDGMGPSPRDDAHVGDRPREDQDPTELAMPLPQVRGDDRGAGKTSAEQPRGAESADSHPSSEDLTRWRALYQEDRESHPTGWGTGVNVVSDKPYRSPGDISDLPPTGKELVHMDREDGSRLEKFGNKMYEEFDDITDVADKVSNRVQQLFDHPPGGQAEVAVPSHPYVSPTAPQHAGLDAGSLADLTLVLGVIGFRTGQILRHKVNERRGR